ncbi:hypothetical protein TNCV_161761, partial [Trichonephila clavipes]
MGLHPISGSYNSYCDIFTEFAAYDLSLVPVHSIQKLPEVFHILPSDIESDESSLSEAEDVMTAKSSSSENTDIDEGEKVGKCVQDHPVYLK